MKTTPIYGIPYLEGSDLVSGAPEQFANMANGVETALNEVDNRNTPEGVKPAIATTLETLAGITGVTGQTGYVTADPTESNNGPYYWDGTAWLPYVTGAMLDALSSRVASTVQTLAVYALLGAITVTRSANVVTVHVEAYYNTVWSMNVGDTRKLLDDGKLPSPATTLIFPAIVNGQGYWDRHLTANITKEGGLSIVARTDVGFNANEKMGFSLTYVATE
uniref:hypothetical protein n=1 Tax=Bifidobacterium adolescentis TaxID=1680 RepID=UPI00359CB63E